jgi:hypothetical protein
LNKSSDEILNKILTEVDQIIFKQRLNGFLLYGLNLKVPKFKSNRIQQGLNIATHGPGNLSLYSKFNAFMATVF